MSFFEVSDVAIKSKIESAIKYGDEDKVAEELIKILNNVSRADIPDILRIVLQSTVCAEKLKNELSEINLDMNCFSISQLLSIDGIDKNIIAKKLLVTLSDRLSIKSKNTCYIFDKTITDARTNDADEITSLINELVEDKNVSKDLKDNLQISIKDNLENILANSYFTMNTINNLLKFGGLKEEILNKKDNIINNIYGLSVPDFYNYCKNNNFPIELDLDKYISLILKDNQALKYNNSEAAKASNELSVWVVKKVIQEMAEYQGITPFDVETLGNGYYANVFKIGDFAIKIGDYRANTENIPYSKHLIQPLLRQKLKGGLYIEVQNIVDTKWYEELSEEEIEEVLFQMYVKLRKDGIIWKDIRKENVGRLLKRNTSNLKINYVENDKNGKRTIKKEEMQVPDSTASIVGRDGNEILDIGEFVIIDLDFLMSPEKGSINAALASIKSDKHDEFDKKYKSLYR